MEMEGDAAAPREWLSQTNEKGVVCILQLEVGYAAYDFSFFFFCSTLLFLPPPTTLSECISVLFL